MAESRQAGLQAAKEVGRDAERAAALGQQAVREAADASTAAASAAQRSGSAVAECAQEITMAWTRYAEEVMRHTSEASQSLMRARTFNEMLEVQAKLLRDNMQAFLDQSVKNRRVRQPHGKAPVEGISGSGYGTLSRIAALAETIVRTPRFVGWAAARSPTDISAPNISAPNRVCGCVPGGERPARRIVLPAP
jgi:hypothetical protein